MFVLHNLRLAACVFERLCSCSNIFIAFAIAVYSSALNLLIKLPLLFYFMLYPVCITSRPQDPIIRSSAAKRTKGRFEPVLGSTPSAATLSGSYPRAQGVGERELDVGGLSLLHPLLHGLPTVTVM